MNRNFFGTLSLAVLSLTLTSGAHAQSVVKADIPFSFNVGATQMSAGQYQIKEDHTRLSISILNLQTGAIVTVPVQQDDSWGLTLGSLTPWGNGWLERADRVTFVIHQDETLRRDFLWT